MKDLKALTICGAGVGTSALLKMNIDKAFSQLNLPFRVDVENAGLSRAKTISADVIFTFETFEYDSGEFNAPVIIIKNLMDMQEITGKIHTFLSENNLLKE